MNVSNVIKSNLTIQFLMEWQYLLPWILLLTSKIYNIDYYILVYKKIKQHTWSG